MKNDNDTSFGRSFAMTMLGACIAAVLVAGCGNDHNTTSSESYPVRPAEMRVFVSQIPDNRINPGETYDMGLMSTASPKTISIIVENSGEEALILTAPPAIDGENSGEFRIDGATMRSSLGRYEKTTFTVCLAPMSPGIKSADITVFSDAETFTFTLSGKAMLIEEITKDDHGHCTVPAAYNSIATDNNDGVFVSYLSGTKNNLNFAKSLDGGQTWTSTVADPTYRTGYYNAIAVHEDNVYITHLTLDTFEMKVAVSDDAGEHFTHQTIDDSGQVRGFGTSISVIPDGVDGDDLYIFYTLGYGGLNMAKSVVGGQPDTWTIRSILPEELFETTVYFPAHAVINSVDGDNGAQDILYTTFLNASQGTLWFMKSEDGGQQWSGQELIDIRWGFPTIAVNAANDIFIACFNYDSQNADPTSKKSYLLTSRDGGDSWDTILLPEYAELPYVLTDDDAIYINYLHSSDKFRVKIAKSEDYGATWSILSIDQAYSESRSYPAVVDRSGFIHLVYPAHTQGQAFLGDQIKFAKITSDMFSFDP